MLNIFLALTILLAQVRVPGPGGASAGGGGGSWEATAIAHGSTLGNGGGTGRSIGPLDCTGATHYFFAATAFSTGIAGTTPTYNDGMAHNFTNVTGEADSTGNTTSAAIWWAEVTGSNSVSFGLTTDYGPIFAACWKIGAASSSFDQESGSGTVACYTCAPSLTPSVNDSLIIVIASSESGTTGLSATGYTVLESQDYTPGTSFGGALAFRVLTGGSGVAQNPTFSNTGGSGTIKMANFKPL